jgi:hypothetical protein
LDQFRRHSEPFCTPWPLSVQAEREDGARFSGQPDASRLLRAANSEREFFPVFVSGVGRRTRSSRDFSEICNYYPMRYGVFAVFSWVVEW